MYLGWNVAENPACANDLLTDYAHVAAMLRYSVLLVICLLVAGCNTPGPAFRGAEPIRISVDQSTFDVRVDGDRAQAIRLNMEWAPRPAVVAPRAVAAIERVSGCAVSRLEGDQAVFVASLDCGAESPPRPIFPLDLECDAYDLKDGYGTLECRPYP